MKTDYSAYPPQLAADMEITEQQDGERLVFIVGSAAVGRYIILRETEEKVLRLIGSGLTPGALCAEFQQQYGATLKLAMLTKFLAKLDEVGLLTGERAAGYGVPDQPGMQFYTRFKLFNPDRLFTLVIPALRWIWTTEFFFCTIFLLCALTLLALLNWAEVASYAEHTMREHYIAIGMVGLLIGITHEFAHGLTCKAFGGRASEVGVLLIYYFLPALYCNVSGLHLIPQRGRRLWVILAGVYWQVLVGILSLLVWFAVAPHTLIADFAFISFLGSVVDVVFNANPLIKLDGYYFLSQWLRLPNLMDRARAYWRGLLKRILLGEENEAAAQWSRRERTIYAVFGLLSFVYTVGLRIFIVFYVGSYLADAWGFTGLLLAAVLALFYARQPLRQLSSAATSMIGRIFGSLFEKRREETMASNSQAALAAPVAAQRKRWRRRLVPLTIGLVIAVILCLPWDASVGNYGTLIAIPGEESIIRAPESATLIALQAQPGQQIAAGSRIGQMGDLGLEEQIVQVQSELARVNADYDRLQGEMRAHAEATTRAELQLRQRRREYDEINDERRQIAAQRPEEVSAGGMQFLAASTSAPSFASSGQTDSSAVRYPAALAVLQSDVDARRAQLDEASAQRDRARRLYAQGITPRSDLETTETRARTLAIELTAARDRLEAALVEHRRRYASVATELNLARSDVSAAALQTDKLDGEMRATRALIATLENRRDLLRRKQAQFVMVTTQSGTIFGEDLLRAVGQYFQKGAEICRIADTRRLLLRLQVPEREIGDVHLGQLVRLKARALPDRIFRGLVSKIGGESELDEYRQATYRVELTIENGDGLLRPGMTAFARIDFDRQMIGRILLHKIKQVLRPEMWLL
jgi:multidrug resistance efflux pump